MDIKKKSDSFDVKWPGDITNRGYVQAMKCLFTCMKDLDITTQELAVLLNLLDHHWTARDKPFPSVKRMADDINKGESTVKALTRSLADKGFFIKEPQYNSSVQYNLQPLIGKLQDHLEICRYYTAKFDHENSGAYCSSNPYSRRHEWKTYDTEKNLDTEGQQVVWRYWSCIYCDVQIHRKLNPTPSQNLEPA